jgi:hypothetical protein
MPSFFTEQYKKNKLLRYISLFFLGLSIWWLSIYVRGLTEGPENDYFILIYPVLPLIGGIYGLISAKKWGGLKSSFGKAVSLLSLGFLAQFFGQILYVYYQLYLHIEVPYPSVGDWFYFASVILYLVGTYQLASVAGIKLTLKTIHGKLLALAVPFLILLLSYFILLQGYEADWSDKVVVFLDFGYPILQAVSTSIALLIVLISKDILGGLMRKPVMLLVLALVAQAVSDFVFSYQVSREEVTFYAAGTNDYMFAFAYFLMTIALFSIGNMFYKIKESNNS